MGKNKKFSKYFKEYQWSNVFAMVKNNRLDPESCNEDFRHRLVVITGATSGIGYHTARLYAARGANLFCINRNPEKSEALKKEIEAEFGVRCEYALADLSDLHAIHRVGEILVRLDFPIDVLIHNAGIYLTRRSETAEGMDKVFVVHYLSSFVINYLLLDKLRGQSAARIILVNSEAHRFAAWGLRLDDLNWEKRRYSGLKSYGSAKTAQLLSMLVFADLLKDTGVTINAMHPGAVKSNTGKENGAFYRWIKKNLYERHLQSPDVSAEALYYLGVSKDVEKITGKFFNKTTLEEPAPPALDKEVACKLWEKSLELSGLQ